MNRNKVEELIKYFPKKNIKTAQRLVEEEDWKELFNLTKIITDNDFCKDLEDIPESSLKLNELFVELMDFASNDEDIV